ncbi:MAG: transporter substrate-binding domain-containing protein [Azospirillaceae bacterium]|nr:transporter substrate-binding domain-containing protein [Azospirillaceae bacterium]
MRCPAYMSEAFKRFAALSVVALAAAHPASAASLLDRIVRDHVIVIGTANDAPLSAVEKDSRKAAGIFPDVLREVLKRNGLQAEIRPVAMPFASLIPALTSGRIDMIADSMYATAARKQVIDFTGMVFYNPEILDVPRGNPRKLHTLADLCGLAAGSYEGTTFVGLLRTASSACPAGKPIEIRQYPTLDNVFADLSAGRLDAAVAASSLSAYALQQNPALAFELVADYKPADRSAAGSAMGVSQGDDAFLAKFNAAYSAMLADGTSAAIFTKWGLTPTDFFLAR